MAFHKVLAAVDETPAGTHALRVGAQVAAAAEAELVALRVVDDPWRFIEPSEVEAKRAMRDAAFAAYAAERVADELRELMSTAGLGNVRATTAVRFGLPSVEIARWAELERADLVVLGRQPAGELERRPAGRTIDGTLRRSRVPCLIAPFGQRTWNRVVTLADEGVGQAEVLQRAFDFAELFHSEVLLLQVEPQPATVSAGVGETVGRKAFASWARLPHAGTFDVTVRHGDPVTQVLKTAREGSADLIVLGYCRGESAGAEATSDAARILHRAPCAVLTVPV